MCYHPSLLTEQYLSAMTLSPSLAHPQISRLLQLVAQSSSSSYYIASHCTSLRYNLALMLCEDLPILSLIHHSRKLERPSYRGSVIDDIKRHWHLTDPPSHASATVRRSGTEETFYLCYSIHSQNSELKGKKRERTKESLQLPLLLLVELKHLIKILKF